MEGKSKMSVRRAAGTVAVLAAVALVVTATWAGAVGVTAETEDVVGQGSLGPVVAEDGATLQRSDGGISAKVKMPTPVPGTYAYPGPNAFQPLGALFVPGAPEAFSLWAFVFNFPELCSAPCDSNDIGATPAMGGVFNVAGHVVGGPTLSLAGHVSVSHTPFAGSPLLEPRTAEVHLAVAPHGALQPDVLPDQIKKPIGSPPFWWLAIFD